MKRIYGTDHTNLTLTCKAIWIYNANCLMDIFEHEDESGTLAYSYTIGGPETERMSKDDLNRELEAMYDRVRGTSMTYADFKSLIGEIDNEIHALLDEQENLDGLGATDLEIALEYRRDSFDGPYDSYVEPTPEELEALKGECRRNLDKYCAIQNKIDALTIESQTLYDAIEEMMRQ